MVPVGAFSATLEEVSASAVGAWFAGVAGPALTLAGVGGSPWPWVGVSAGFVGSASGTR